CSPTNSAWACAGPSPKTVWVAFFHKGQARQCAASSRRVRRLEAVIMGIPLIPWDRPNGGYWRNAGGMMRVPFKPLNALAENLLKAPRLTLLAMLALY